MVGQKFKLLVKLLRQISRNSTLWKSTECDISYNKCQKNSNCHKYAILAEWQSLVYFLVYDPDDGNVRTRKSKM